MLVPVHVREQLQSEEQAGRIARSTSSIFTIWTEKGLIQAEVSGKLRHQGDAWPVVGDWVVYKSSSSDKAVIQRVLARTTVFSRKEPGGQHNEQVMAANMDTVLIVTSITTEFNLQRLERYVYQVYESGAAPAIVCTKSDLSEDAAEFKLSIERRIPAVPVYTISSVALEGIEEFHKELKSGHTYLLTGSSGVGKSTLINRLLGEEVLSTNQVRAKDDKGRHTTTHREMFTLDNGAVIIDTPGLRELQLWGGSDSVEAVFSDIEALSHSCKFRNCQHKKEPGCAILQAVHNGELSEERVKNYHKLERELHRLELKDKYGTHRANRILHGPRSSK
nr:ribosome small subunit-dependent GTPase A [Halobacillus sp. A5]